MSLVFVTLLALGCADGGLLGGDVGTVTVTCTFDYAFGEDHQTGDWPGFRTDCETWAESGEQSMFSVQAACEQDGLDQGADVASCACDEDPGTCTFPGGVND